MAENGKIELKRHTCRDLFQSFYFKRIFYCFAQTIYHQCVSFLHIHVFKRVFLLLCPNNLSSVCFISTAPCLKETDERETAEDDAFELDENMVSYLELENDSQDTVQDRGQGNYDAKFE